MSWPSRFRPAGRKLLVTVVVAAVAIGLITAATVLGGSQQPRLTSIAPWELAPHMLHRRSYTASAELGGKIYVAAGMVGNTGRPLNIFERFDPETNEWDSLPLLPEPFSAAAGAALGGTMYVIGGNGLAVATGRQVAAYSEGPANGRQVFAYNTASRRWSRKASLPVPRTNLAAVALGGKIYAVGGLDPFHATRTVFVYDPARNRWSRGPSLPEALHALAAVVFRDEVWVIGGQDSAGKATNRVWIYNAGRHAWRAGPRMPARMETAGAAVAGNRIHVVLEKVYLIYDARTHRWTRGPSLQVPRHALAVYAINGTLYAIGGCVAPQLEDSAVVEKLALAG
jgi:N-acetylneuraminic acid mutarotase